MQSAERLPRMNDTVLDSSIILAILKNETIDDIAYSIVDGGVMSAVNVAEVYTKLSELKLVSVPQVDAMLATLDRIEPFTARQAKICGLLRERTTHLGMSLGDRACIALAIDIGGEVFTTDGQWVKLEFGCKVQNLRR